jgi:holo-[acyl-carrier protein] synthase
MITGIGHDLVAVERVRAILAGRTGTAFRDRILTPEERGYARQTIGDDITHRRWAEYAAGRFAAKEAAAKALGCGIGRFVGFQDLNILPDEAGKPCCTLSEEAYRRLGLRTAETRIHVTITHTAELASAVVIMERLI